MLGKTNGFKAECHLAFESRATTSPRPLNGFGVEVERSPRRERKSVDPMPSFIAPQLCKNVSRPPIGQDWVHEIKLDGYRMQLRVEDGEAFMCTRKGLDWTAKFAGGCRSGKRASGLHHRRRGRCARSQRRTGFFGLTGGALRGALTGPDLLRLRPLV